MFNKSVFSQMDLFGLLNYIFFHLFIHFRRKILKSTLGLKNSNRPPPIFLIPSTLKEPPHLLCGQQGETVQLVKI